MSGETGVLKVKVPRDVIITNAETVFREFNRDLRDPRQHGIPYDCELVGQHPGTDDALFRAHLNKLSLDSMYEALVGSQAAEPLLTSPAMLSRLGNEKKIHLKQPCLPCRRFLLPC